ncbi:Outer membrane protein assembly factor BamB, contains PQQ-like beta-propeller repeat [Streptomyces sp. DvalAA-14]|uniref:outer membrane protein assembly factor BamB family protein n=1 Tax=unclassified Streptomyces TaxID=2593676 RepID=UPI00081B02E5|nr:MULTISPECIES: PQQ-binding-like beta-propeller repeat protein [unclassified Streptomyces]MYS20681.1 PQQ-binding-like beta-propeller repeat protein [Streptomyces sp. SID4948]SCD74586.1 Outer membrane protein assembly factor BamB, contains PQQ-like beta-propeller repeat [Streptomyces sp. DvalAA-14]
MHARFRLRIAVVAAAASASLALSPVTSPFAATQLPGSTATAEESHDATPAYRVDASLDSSVTGATAKPPYRQLWSRDFGTMAGSPITVGDRVFAVVNAAGPQDPGPDMKLVGLDARTGQDLWPAKELTPLTATAAYGGGLLYTQTEEGLLTAWDPARGTRVWQTQLDRVHSFIWDFPPTWYKGVLYTQGGSTSVTTAIRATDGRILWNTTMRDTGETPVAVDAQGVWVAHDDITYQLLDPADGHELRHYNLPPYFDGGGNPPVLAHGDLWLRGDYPVDPTDQVTAFDEKTGTKIRSFPADSTPAFDAGHAYITYQGVLRALDAKTFATDWTYTSPVGSAAVRLVANGYVYVEDADGLLLALNAADGRTAWSVRIAPAPNPNSAIPGERDWAQFTVPGLGTAHGRLVVPAGGGLVAFGPAGDVKRAAPVRITAPPQPR